MRRGKKAVVLLSGGLDSATAMAIAKSEGYEIYGLSFYYGQHHALELKAAHRIAQTLGVKQRLIIDIDLTSIGGSALTDNIDVPKDRSSKELLEGIPITYVPARNTIFLSYAVAWAEVIRSSNIFIGVNAIDYSGYPDCRQEYIEAFERMANLATKAAVQGKVKINIRTPLIHMTKAQIITRGIALGIDYSMTFSCYDPSVEGLACGHCDSCILRKKGFAEAGIPDPTLYGS